MLYSTNRYIFTDLPVEQVQPSEDLGSISLDRSRVGSRATGSQVQPTYQATLLVKHSVPGSADIL